MGKTNKSRKVIFVHRVTCDYSKTFFVKLHGELLKAGVDFVVASGSPWKDESLVDVLSQLPFGVRCENKRIVGSLFWSRGALKTAYGADLVIIEQLNGSLHFYPLIFRRYLRVLRGIFAGACRHQKLAFWGHGATLNAAKHRPMLDSWKRFFAGQVDWWFAYTDVSARILAEAGFPSQRITVFQNTIDTEELIYERRRLEEDDLMRVRKSLFGDQNKKPTGVFCARLVGLKWIPFLLESLELIHGAMPDFRMIIIGDGPYRSIVSEYCRKRPWCVWLGAKRGLDRVQYFALGDVWLNPGATGLAIVDAFAMGLPIFTTDNRTHGPEIAYLRNRENGILTKPEVGDFAEKVVHLLKNPLCLQALKKTAEEDCTRYSVTAMVNNFTEGILKCLDLNEATI